MNYYPCINAEWRSKWSWWIISWLLHQDISAEEAQRHVANIISNEWKRLNQEIIIPNAIFSSSFTKFCLNVARMVPLMYHYKSNPSLTNLQALVKSLLVNVNARCI
jgi:(3S)-linalool synthase